MGQWNGPGGWEQQPPQGWQPQQQGGGQPPPPGVWGGAPPPGAWPPPAPAPGRLRPLTLADVLDGMFRMFLAHWRTYILALGLILVPMNFVLAVLGGFAGVNTGMWDQFFNPTTAQAAFQNGPELIALLSLIVISLLTGLFVTPFVTGVACRIAADAFDGADPQTGEVLRRTLPRYWALFGVTVLLLLLFIGVMIIPAAMIGGAIAADAPGLGVLGGLLMFAAVLVIVWLYTRFRLAYVAVVVENAGPVAALRRSAQLVEGRWWRVFGTLLLAGIISGIVSQIAAAPFSFPGSMFGEVIGVVLITAGTVIASIITTPLSANAQTLLYYDGRIRNEGYDLEVMARAVGSPGNQPPAPGPAFG